MERAFDALARGLGWPGGRGLGTPYRAFASLRFLLTRDRDAAASFLLGHHPTIRRLDKVRLIHNYLRLTQYVRGYHTQAELLTVADAILRRRRPGHPVVVVEAGAGHGSSTAKLSLAVALAGGGVLHVFDSFRGIPENDEVHRHKDGRVIRFRKGAFAGRLERVKRTVARFGCPELCVFHKGWFEDTLPSFEGSVDVALLDVDLWSSTRTCLAHLLPRLRSDGVLFSQDGHLVTITERLEDPKIWRDELGMRPPRIRGLGRAKLLRFEPDRVDDARPFDGTRALNSGRAR